MEPKRVLKPVDVNSRESGDRGNPLMEPKRVLKPAQMNVQESGDKQQVKKMSEPGGGLSSSNKRYCVCSWVFKHL